MKQKTTKEVILAVQTIIEGDAYDKRTCKQSIHNRAVQLFADGFTYKQLLAELGKDRSKTFADGILNANVSTSTQNLRRTAKRVRDGVDIDGNAFKYSPTQVKNATSKRANVGGGANDDRTFKAACDKLDVLVKQLQEGKYNTKEKATIAARPRSALALAE